MATDAEIFKAIGELGGRFDSLERAVDTYRQETNTAISELRHEVNAAKSSFESYATTTLPAVRDAQKRNGSNGDPASRLSEKDQQALKIGRWWQVSPDVLGMVRKTLLSVGAIVVVVLTLWREWRTMKLEDVIAHARDATAFVGPPAPAAADRAPRHMMRGTP